MIKRFVNRNHKCTICECIFTEDEGGTLGDLGMLPVSFCPSCFSGLCEMVGQGNKNEWVDLTNQEIEQAHREKCNEVDHWLDKQAFLMAIWWSTEKLKEKNT